MTGHSNMCRCTSKSCHIKTDKIEKYIKDGRLMKLKSHVRKYKIDMQHILLKRGRNLLHYCCKLSSDSSWHGSIVRYLLHVGVSCEQKDDKGNIPLHYALKTGLKQTSSRHMEIVYEELVLPQLEVVSHILKRENRKRVTCRQLLAQYLEEKKRLDGINNLKETDSGETDEDLWRERLSRELQDEEFEQYGGGQDYFHGEFNEETEEEWNGRMYKEMKYRESKKRRHNTKEGKADSDDPRKKRRTDAEEKLKKSRERMKNAYEKYQKEAKENRKRIQKEKYERRLKLFFSEEKHSEISYDDIPWPCEKVDEISSILLWDLDSDSETYKKYLREQQISWHPDKFTQRIGNWICDSDREKVLLKVKEISQELNRLADQISR